MRDWRTPSAQLLKGISSSLFAGAKLVGTFEPLSKRERAMTLAQEVPFFGNRPGISFEMTARKEGRLAFTAPRPEAEEVEDISYSPTGMAWHQGRLVERFSVAPIRPVDILRLPKRPSSFIERCVLVEADYTYAYADWVQCCLGTLIAGDREGLPVLLPSWLAQKGYVQRDLAKAGIDFIAAEGWTRIGRAKVLRKATPLFFWRASDVAAFRSVYAPAPLPPQPGSLLYLGRFDVVGETIPRHFPSNDVADIIGAAGGTIVRQAELNSNSAAEHAVMAETVIGDHGSGLVNIMFWRPRTVIELVAGGWWTNNTLMLAAGMGVENFAVIDVDGLSRDELRVKLDACMARFGLPLLSDRGVVEPTV